MSTEKAALLESARAALALAKKHGAGDAAATVHASRDIWTTWRDGKIEKVSEAASRSVELALYVDGKYGAMSTSDLRSDALDRFVENAVGLVRALAKDPHRTLPDPALYAARPLADLEIFDPKIAERTPEVRLAAARAAEEGARSASGADRITSVTVDVSDYTYDVARATSNGFEGGYRASYTSNNATVALKDDDGRRPSDFAGGSVRFASDLPDPAAIGREATERATGRLRAKKIGSGTMSMIVEARAVGTLLNHVLGPLSGRALQQKQSFFENKLNAQVASRVLTLSDEPLLKRGLSSRPFDGEGISCRPRAIIENGTLRTYFLDVYYASKLGVKPTTSWPTNVVVAPGKKSVAALMKDMKSGIFVTDFIGGNSNSTTGAFSLGLAGFRVADGERKEAISEMNLSGTHLDFWNRLVAVGDDPYVYSSMRAPSLLFQGVSIAGK
jgi:PmbA protein